MRYRILVLFGFIGCCFANPLFSQTEDIQLNAEKIEIYQPYVQARLGLSSERFQEWKSTNKLQFTKEIWYFSESFYIKKKNSRNGVSIDPANIDISRYESFRKAEKEYVLEIEGFCDAIVLLPANKLIYKP